MDIQRILQTLNIQAHNHGVMIGTESFGSGPTIDSISPVDGKKIASLSSATDADYERAVEAAAVRHHVVHVHHGRVAKDNDLLEHGLAGRRGGGRAGTGGLANVDTARVDVDAARRRGRPERARDGAVQRSSDDGASRRRVARRVRRDRRRASYTCGATHLVGARRGTPSRVVRARRRARRRRGR